MGQTPRSRIIFSFSFILFRHVHIEFNYSVINFALITHIKQNIPLTNSFVTFILILILNFI